MSLVCVFMYMPGTLEELSAGLMIPLGSSSHPAPGLATAGLMPHPEMFQGNLSTLTGAGSHKCPCKWPFAGVSCNGNMPNRHQAESVLMDASHNDEFEWDKTQKLSLQFAVGVHLEVTVWIVAKGLHKVKQTFKCSYVKCKNAGQISLHSQTQLCIFYLILLIRYCLSQFY